MSPRVPLVVACLSLAPALLGTACSPAGSSPNEVIVAGLDYAFEAPDTLPPGPTLFRFENRGEVRHEMVLVRLKEGITLEDVMKGVREGGDPADFIEGGLGILLVGPGRTTANALHVDLLPGRDYALICNLRDSPEDPPHTELGMRASFHVGDGAG